MTVSYRIGHYPFVPEDLRIKDSQRPGHKELASNSSRSASMPAPGFVASKSPPSEANPVVLTCSWPVPFSSEPSGSSLDMPSTAKAGSSFSRPASPPCSRATSARGLGPGPSTSTACAEGSSGSRVSFWPDVVSPAAGGPVLAFSLILSSLSFVSTFFCSPGST